MVQPMIKRLENYEMPVELLQPWSTFVMATELPPPILERMIKITDEIVENKKSDSQDLNAGQVEDQFFIDLEILEQEEVMEFFLNICKKYVIRAQCQSQPTNKKKILQEKWLTEMNTIWINSQKDNEYFPIHYHTDCSLSAVMYLKIPEFLPSRKSYNNEEDGAITFINNSSQDKIWLRPTLTIQPKVGDFFIFPASMQHQVFPFRTSDGKGERRSVSFNAVHSNKTVQDKLKKQQEIN